MLEWDYVRSTKFILLQVRFLSIDGRIWIESAIKWNSRGARIPGNHMVKWWNDSNTKLVGASQNGENIRKICGLPIMLWKGI